MVCLNVLGRDLMIDFSTISSFNDDTITAWMSKWQDNSCRVASVDCCAAVPYTITTDNINDILARIEKLEKEKEEEPVPMKLTTCSDDFLTIDHVIFSGPATIVFWTDGDKTIVKCTEDDEYSYEVGIAMATLKKIFGSSYSTYRHDVRKAIDKEIERQIKKKEVTKKDAEGLVKIANAIMDSILKGDKDGK